MGGCQGVVLSQLHECKQRNKFCVLTAKNKGVALGFSLGSA